MTLYYYMYRSWKDCCRRGENRSWPSVSVESVDSEYWCLNNAIVYAFIMRLKVEERVLRSTFKLNTLYMNSLGRWLGEEHQWVLSKIALRLGPSYVIVSSGTLPFMVTLSTLSHLVMKLLILKLMQLLRLSNEHYNIYIQFWQLFCMGVKLGRWHWGRKGSWGCLRIWCWGEYLDLGGTR